MRDKKGSLTVDQVNYLYSIKVSADMIKIIVYRSFEKVPVFTAYVNYVEAWGFDVYRPKMTEILIRYCLETGSMKADQKIRLCEHPRLFALLLDCFFQDDEQARADFAEKCRLQQKSRPQRIFA